MADYILIMHTLAPADETPLTNDATWDDYLNWLGSTGAMRGGSAIGTGACFRKSGIAPAITSHLDGYIKVEADSLEAAQAFLKGNPVYESGGTVEIRELPQED